MAVTVGKRIQAMIDYMDKGEFELALSEVCIAIDITSQKHFGVTSSSRRIYKEFLSENMWMIITAGMEKMVGKSLKIPFAHPSIRTSNVDGYCSLEEIVYHVMRCGLVHGTGENSKLKWNPRVQLTSDAEGDLNISPAFIWGLALCVITCEANKDETVGEGCWISMATFKYLVNDLWGKRSSIESIVKEVYGLSVSDLA